MASVKSMIKSSLLPGRFLTTHDYMITQILSGTLLFSTRRHTMTARRFFGSAGFLAVALLPFVAGAQAGDDKDKEDKKFNLVFVPTPESVVEKMFEMAKVNKKDVVFDLGCGNGIIVCMAAKKFGIKAVGVDLNPERIKECHEMVKKFGVEKLVDIRQGDALKVKDFDRAS